MTFRAERALVAHRPTARIRSHPPRLLCSIAATDFEKSRSLECYVGQISATPIAVRYSVGLVVERRRACRVRLVTRWDKDHHSLPRARQQNAVRVQQVSLPVLLMNRRPRVSSKGVVTPRLGVSPQVGVPGHAHPIELETLNLEFGCGVLQVIARSRIVPIV